MITASSETVLYAGLFGYLEGATVCNLVLGEHCSVTQTVYNDYASSGALSGKAVSTTFDNVYNAASVTSDSPHAAGFAGRGNATVLNSTNVGAMTAINSGAGFVGFNEGSTVIENSRNTGEINASTAAGFVSRLRGNVTVKNSINNGTIIGGVYASGIGGHADREGTRIFENCINYGHIKAPAEGWATVISGIHSEAESYMKGDAEVPIPPATVTACYDYYGIETDTYVAPTFVCDPTAPEDTGNLDETAFVTTAKPNTSDIPVNTNPTGDEIGFSSARIEHYDTTTIVDIKNYEQAPYEDFYKITDVEGFAMLDAQLYNYSTFSDVTIFLANDIDFSGVEGFRPISYDVEHAKHVNGMPRFYFSGILDGQGEAICNLRVNSTEKALTFTAEELNNKVDLASTHKISLQKGPNGEELYEFKEAFICSSLFGITGYNAEIKNLILDDTCEFTYSGTVANPCVAAIVGRTYGPTTIDNVWNRANIEGGKWMGAICGRPSGKYDVRNTTNSGNVTGTGCVGGFFGFDGAGGLIQNSRNVGNITRLGSGTTFYSASAGFVARARAAVQIMGCINNGTVTGASNCGAFLGTIAASNDIVDCINYGLLITTVEGGKIGIGHAANETTSDGALKGAVFAVNVVDKTGQVDPTLKYETYQLDFTPEPSVETTATIITCTTPAPICKHLTTYPIEIIAPTHTETGLAADVCLNCGEILRADIVIDKLEEHDFKELDEYNAEQHRYVCECGEELLEDHEWDEGTVVVAPTELTEGYTLYQCQICKKNHMETVPALGVQTTETVETTTEATTEATTTAATTEATTVATTTGADEGGKDAENGCNGTLIGSFSLILLVTAAAVTVCKKKED